MKEQQKNILRARIKQLKKDRIDLKKELSVMGKKNKNNPFGSVMKEILKKREELYKISRNISANSFRLKYGYMKK